MHVRGVTGCALLALLTVGCRDQPDRQAEQSRPAADGAAPPPPADPVVELDGLKRLVATYRDQVVYVDFWATWCVPCVQALPELAQFQERYGSRGLQVIAVSFDDPEHWAERARPTLERAGWNGPAVVVRDREAQIAIVDWLGTDWRSGLPARFLIGRGGKPVHEFIASRSEKLDKLEETIEQLLAGASSAAAEP